MTEQEFVELKEGTIIYAVLQSKFVMYTVKERRSDGCWFTMENHVGLLCGCSCGTMMNNFSLSPEGAVRIFNEQRLSLFEESQAVLDEQIATLNTERSKHAATMAKLREKL